MSEEWDRYGISGFTDAAEIGRGGFGVVYRAHQTSLERVVAIKVIGTQQRRSRVESELRALGTLSGHPNIVTVFSHGESPNGHLYIVMEYLAGGSLQDALDIRGALPVADVVDTGVKLAGALETAHRHGILHRDIKPANVLVNRFGEPQLGDFGIARLLTAAHTSTTGSVTGTLAHTPAELLEGEDATVRSDVFSLGSTLYTVLTGRPPFVDDPDITVANLLFRIVKGDYPDMRERGLPGAVADVVDAMLARDPADRPASAEAAGQLLRDAQASQGWSMAPMFVADRTPHAAPDHRPSTAGEPSDTADVAVGGALPTVPVAQPELPTTDPPASDQPPSDQPALEPLVGPSSGSVAAGERGRSRLVVGAMAVVVVGLAGLGVAVFAAGDDAGGAPTERAAPAPTADGATEAGVDVVVVPKPSDGPTIGPLATEAELPLPTVTIELDHPRPADLVFSLGVQGDADGPACEVPLTMSEAVDDGVVVLAMTLQDCADLLPPTAERRWFLHVADVVVGEEGTVEAFGIDTDAVSLRATELPIAVPDDDADGVTLLLPDGIGPTSTPAEPTDQPAPSGPAPAGPAPAPNPPAPAPNPPAPVPNPPAPQQPPPVVTAPQPQPAPPDPPPTVAAD
ncbi:serine/threonine-protein kinase [Euzebya rosea]|uniref:serine/threonine-protein kinase n=1 Tax=Euzebya rosea TaxID=2052804 RepID=UPI000D3E389D|nr:serine/threonine-protein kinase [Euzebya rosea]